ncbi:MAG: Histidinol-phosphate aminotransferase [Verrucomicrobiales bacterium]|nr:Histidinol-phosphate aminotransferase [Verrucomicrobiales bacterium]
MKVASYIRPLVANLDGYVPGEQPKVKDLIKLNTNENPYPPSPGVISAIRKATDSRLRLYPNPTCEPLRNRLAKYHRCHPEQILVGNGSDEILALVLKAFVEPSAGSVVNKDVIQYFTPSYSLYPVLASIHGCRANPVALGKSFEIPALSQLKRRGWNFSAPLSLVTTPNAPSGTAYTTSTLEQLCRKQKGIILLDEAYGDFAQENAMELALKIPNVLVARTFSKAFSLCFQRIGYCVGDVQLIQALDKIRDSYNVNGLGQIAAEATLDDINYYHKTWKRIIDTREGFTSALRALKFEVAPSQTNFIFAKPPDKPAKQWLQILKDNKILVRWFPYPETKDYLRITIGTEAQMKSCLKVFKAFLNQ